MDTIAPVSGRQFAAFRIVFGVYLTIHFAHLIPWGAELFSRAGMLPTAALNPMHGIIPNVLAHWDAPRDVTVVLLTLTICAALFTLGIARRTKAIVLWYGWACLFNRNVLISNPSIPYVGLLLLLTTLVPPTEPWRFTRRSTQQHDNDALAFGVPRYAWMTAWVLLAVGYTFSGLVKLASPSWCDGTALQYVLDNPLARTGWWRDWMLALTQGVLHLMTWGTLALEILFVPLALWRRTRPWIWLALIGVHLGIMSMVRFADLTMGMLMIHAFTFDDRWLVWRRSSGAQ